MKVPLASMLLFMVSAESRQAGATISRCAHICAGTHDHTKPDFPLQCPPITIAPEAWVCAHALVGRALQSVEVQSWVHER